MKFKQSTFEDQLKKTAERVKFTRFCDGTENCKSQHHLIICHSLKKN